MDGGRCRKRQRCLAHCVRSTRTRYADSHTRFKQKPNKKGLLSEAFLFLHLVEVAGFEPASANPLP